MPYYGQDWRQPGELWVRTPEGWESMQLWRVKFLGNLNENFKERFAMSFFFSYQKLF